MKEQILKLSKEGKKVKEIALELNIWESQVRYHLNPEYRNKAVSYSINYKRNWSKAQREKFNQSRREYNRNYMKRRYAEDLEFRERTKLRAKEYSKRKHGMS